MEMVQVIAAIALLAGNAYFVAVEFSVTRARPTMVAELVSEGATGARSLAHGVKHIDNYLSACQLGITVCSIGLGITAEPVVKEALAGVLGDSSVLGIAAGTLAFVVAYGLVSMFHVVLGELAPKSLAIARTRRTGLLLLPPMRIFYFATRPVVDALNWMGNAVLRPFGIPPASEAETEVHSEDELRALIDDSTRRGVLDPEENAFAVGAFTFGDRRVHEVMVPRRQVVVVHAGQDLRDAAHAAAHSGHRRIPLVERDRDLDAPLGVLHLTDVARALADGEQTDLRDAARPLHETSEATLLDDLLEELRSRRQRMSLVRDEHGTALGIITLEDILEQVVGDLRDELDPPPDSPVERSADGLEVAGEAHVHALRRELGLDFGRHREATVSGLLIERLGHVPAVGEQLETGGVRLEALEVDGPQVTRVGISGVDGEREAPRRG